MNAAAWFADAQTHYYTDELGTHLYVPVFILPHTLTFRYVNGLLQPGDITPIKMRKEAAMALPGYYKHFHQSKYYDVYVPYNPFATPPHGLTFMLNPGPMPPTDGTALLEQIMTDPSNNILQIKGWGSGIQQRDYENLFFPGIEVNLTNQAFLKTVEQHIGPMLGSLFGRRFWLQWDGDKIEHDTYGFLLAAVAYILNQYDMLHGLICMKLTEEHKAPNFVQEFLTAKGGDKLRTLCPNLPMILVAYPIEKDPKVKAEQMRTRFGFYGASLNNMFAGHKTILAFGGGSVLSAEDANGYVNSSIIAIDMGRKGGTEVSKFARKYM